MFRKLYILLIGILFFMAGCANDVNSDFGVVTISPSSLFQGDLKRLEPHLGLTTGSVEVKYKGNKSAISCKYEIWKKGKLVETNRIMANVINGVYEGEVSFSLKEMLLDNLDLAQEMVMKTVIADKGGYTSSTKFIDRFDKSYSWGPVQLEEQIKFKDDKEVAVWGLFAGDYKYKNKIEDMAKTAYWALVVKVFFEDIK